MGLRRKVWLAAAAMAFIAGVQAPASLGAQAGEGLAPDTASYSIDATLDATARTLTGREVITWRNPGGIPAYSIRLHLYWNAWRNTDSTWISQLKLAGKAKDALERPAAEYGWQEITELRLMNPDGSSGPDLLPGFRYIQPSDQNPDDRSLAAADLPNAVAPGQSIQLRVAWKAQVPRTFARTGGIGNYFFIAQWFPKLGVFEGDGWSARQFFANTEFYADFGRYDVRLTVPQGWVVGATGREVSRTDDGDLHHPPLRTGRCARLRLDDEPGLRGGDAAVQAPDAAAGDDEAAAAAGAPRAGGSSLRGDGSGAEVLRRVVWRLSLPADHHRRSGVAKRFRRHGVPDALHRRHQLAGPAAIERA